ncbi:low density lipoprotein receptor adapter protein 1-B-like isoform X3 [Phyllobates terribilis]|uniref:low density lipoprotein receptor adapter protein 1-B-like isoform X3 n=1 Tax=Phyllobates terribilis TaxID=111132 RepID=UPI003CCA71FE
MGVIRLRYPYKPSGRMDALKSAGRAMMRSPSLGRHSRHRKVPDTWTDSRDALLEGVIFHLKYLGMTLVEEPKGEDMAATAIRRIVIMARASAKRLQKVILTVTPHSITIQDASTAQQIECVSMYRISYCTTDKVQNKVFAYVAQNQSNGALECHAFLSPKKKLAQTVTMTVAQAFTVALDLWQSSKEGRLESSPGSHNVAISPSLDALEPRPDDHNATAMDGPHVPEKGAPHKGGKDQEDNDDFEDFSRTMTPNTSRLCKGYLTKKESDGGLRQMTWPPQSPDLNPIEMVWGELDRRVKAKGPTSAKHLWELLQDCWKQMWEMLFMNYFVRQISDLRA